VTQDTPTLPPNYRRNFTALLVDYVCFGVAITFVDINSVLPAFVGQLTTAAPVIGLVSTIYRGSWCLPQLAAARLISDKPRKKPYVLAGLVGRVTFWITALALWAGLAQYPAAMLVVFLVGLGLWAASDGLASVAWFDILARSIPLRQRGRLIGIAQCTSGLAGIGVGAAVGLILRNLAFPNSYALLFAMAGVAFIPSVIALTLIREPPAAADNTRSQLQSPGGWLRVLAADRTFLYLMLCRILVSVVDLASPFYVGHAKNVLRLPASVVGAFVVAQTMTGVVASVALGLVGGRHGPRTVIRIGSAAATVGPLFALAAHLAGGGWLACAYPLVYVTLGILNSAWMLGFYNYLLEIAPDDMRPAYVGLGNTVMSIMTLAPVLGGGLLARTSYTVLFGVTAGIVALGTLLTLGLKPVQAVMPNRVDHE
jgi:MFS family permease